jgi:hypothetical protein
MAITRPEATTENRVDADNLDIHGGGDGMRPRTGLHYSVANSLTDVIEAWGLVHQSYVERGLIDPNDAALHTVPEAIGTQTAVTLGRIGPVCASTLTSFIDQDRGLALDHVYPEELASMRAAGRRLCEIGLFADRRQHLYRNAAALFELMRYGYHFGCHQQADDLVIGVHPRHAPFYRRLIGFQPAGPERSYATVNDHAVVLLRLDLHEAPRRKPLPRGLRYFVENPVPATQYDQRVRLTAEKIADSPLETFAAPVH